MFESEKVQAEIGVFGGSGFYSFLKKTKQASVKTPFGKPSDKIVLGEYAGRKIAFLPRHGKKHTIPPHAINYRANIWAFKKLGVKRIIAPCAAGSLQPHVKPGEFVVLDQFIDRTKERKDSFFEKAPVTHVSAAEPYCPELRRIAVEAAHSKKIGVHEKGTVVVVQGPRFSTKAESKWFSSQAWHAVNMTQYPECILAREQEICYTGIALITDYDVGLKGHPEIKPVSIQQVFKTFKENNEKIKEMIFEMIPAIPKERKCVCCKALENAVIKA